MCVSQAKQQQLAYRKIEQRIAILRVLLRCSVVSANTISDEAVKATVDELISFNITPKTHTDEQIVIEFNALYQLITHSFYS